MGNAGVNISRGHLACFTIPANIAAKDTAQYPGREHQIDEARAFSASRARDL